MAVAFYIWWNITLYLPSHPEVRIGKPKVCEEEPLEIMLHSCGTCSPIFIYKSTAAFQTKETVVSHCLSYFFKKIILIK